MSKFQSPGIVQFPVKLNCEQWTSLDDDRIMIKFQNYGSKTFYEATALVRNGANINNIWFGIGLNFNRDMVITNS